MQKIQIKDPPDPIDLVDFKKCWENYQAHKEKITNDLIREFIKDKLSINIGTLNGYLEVSLKLEGEIISSDDIYVGKDN